MTTDDNKAVIKRLFAAQMVGDMNAVRSLLAEDVVYSGVAKSRMSYTAGKVEILKIMEAFYARIDGPWEKEILGMTAEGNRVAVEAVAKVQLKGGKRYDQVYHYLYVIEDGRIKVAKEYMDTLYSAETFGGVLTK